MFRIVFVCIQADTTIHLISREGQAVKEYERAHMSPNWGRVRITLRRRSAFLALVGAAARFRKRRSIFSGIGKLAYVSATPAFAFANRSVGDGNHPMVGTMRLYVLGELILVLR